MRQVTGGDEAKVCLKPAVQARFLPDARVRDGLQHRLAQFRELYRQQCQSRSLA